MIINSLKLVFFVILFPLIRILFNERFNIFIFQHLGTTFIKLGQLLSSRPDIVGDNFANSIKNLQDQVKPFPWKQVKRILTKNFGKNLSKIFKDINQTAAASASVAQVHQATLQTGENVAVKILRPNIKQKVKSDLKSLKSLIFIIGIFSKFYKRKLNDIYNLLQQSYEKELDLTQEASAGSLLRENLKNLKGFYIPKICWQYSSNNILVMEWIEGIKFSDINKIKDSKFDKKAIAKNLIISYFTQVYENGFFHADMHGGNLILRNDGSIVAIDFGITAAIDKKTRIAIAEILFGFLQKDYQRVAEIHVEAGIVDKDTNIQELSLYCRMIGEPIVGKDVRDIRVAKLFENLLKMDRKFSMNNKAEFLLLQKTITLVEGVAFSIDENINIWQLSKPWIKNWATKNISFDAKILEKVTEIAKDIKSFLKNY